MFCTCTCSCVHANDAKILRSRDAQCNTKESPQLARVTCILLLPTTALVNQNMYRGPKNYNTPQD